jgi:hypothetical protein
MGAWSADNFGNDGARDYLAILIARLVATISEVVGDAERISPDEDGESLLMPSLEVLAFLCERYSGVPPLPATVQQWRDEYLAAFDRDFNPPKAKSGAKAARRKVVEKTFAWLDSLAQTHHEG